MLINEFEHIFETRNDNFVDFATRIHRPAKPSHLESLRILERYLEAKCEVVGDIGRTDREYFYRNRYALVIDDYGNGFSSDVREHAPLHLLVLGECDVGAGKWGSHAVDHLDVCRFCSRSESCLMSLGAGDEEVVDFKARALKSMRLPKRFRTVHSILEWNLVENPAVEEIRSGRLPCGR